METQSDPALRAPIGAPPLATQRVDIYLSRKAAATWPGAVVLETETGFVLRRRGQPEVLLGENFGGAKQALQLLRQNEAPEPEQS